MKLKYSALVFALCAPAIHANDLVISGVIDGPLSGGIPKALELFVINDVADLATCGVGSANNGGGTAGQEFTFPAGSSATAGSYIYIASESTGFNSFFGFAPTYTSGAASINGDDAIELFCGGVVTDTFGDIHVDGTGQTWEYLDGWAYREADTAPDGATFVLGKWNFSGANALDGISSNADASTPFPLKTYAQETSGGGDAGGEGSSDPAPCFNCPELEKVADASTFDDASYYENAIVEVEEIFQQQS